MHLAEVIRQSFAETFDSLGLGFAGRLVNGLLDLLGWEAESVADGGGIEEGGGDESGCTGGGHHQVDTGSEVGGEDECDTTHHPHELLGCGSLSSGLVLAVDLFTLEVDSKESVWEVKLTTMEEIKKVVPRAGRA